MVGAILTQNTNWGNVEKAINNLKKRHLLNPDKLHKLPLKKLAQLIKPAGYFNIKARRLKNFLNFLFKEYNGDINKMLGVPTERLRKEFLNVNGIGPETADSILLYALDRPIFVIDAYTKRMLLRHKFIKEEATYHQIQDLFKTNLPKSARLFNEYHALIVRLAKQLCKSKDPNCQFCPLNHFPKFSNC